jgi:hypothetical protein
MSATSRLGLESGEDSDESSGDEYPMGYPLNDDTTVGRFLVCEEDRRLYDDDGDDPEDNLDLRRTTTRGLSIHELLLESFS